MHEGQISGSSINNSIENIMLKKCCFKTLSIYKRYIISVIGKKFLWVDFYPLSHPSLIFYVKFRT